MKLQSIGSVSLLALSLAFLSACEEGGTDPDGGTPDGSQVDGGNGQCPATLPVADTTCNVPSCSSTPTKTVGRSELSGDDGTNWLVVTWASSEFASDNENTEVDYLLETSGGLLAANREVKTSRLSEAERSYLYSQRRLDRVRLEARIRAMSQRGPEPASAGTAIEGVRDPSIQKQSTACSAASPTCGTDALCVIPEGTTDGTCETQLSMKWALESPQSPEAMTATVRKVGDGVAIVVDDQDNANVTAADVDEMVSRFDAHIGPLSHQLFGEPAQKDKDQNGVVMILLTSRLRNIGDEFVGIFFSDDMRATANAAHSNAADILYMQPPRTGIAIDQISGTVAHEYQHLLSFTSKVIVNQNAESETVWLDEGISSFAEDLLGYGEDAFANVAVYLQKVGLTSLTGYGLEHIDARAADSNERRGMAHLMVRYLYERAGGASFPAAPGQATDQGGIALIRTMVTGGDTGFDALSTASGNQAFDALLGDLMTTVALDGTALECLDDVGLAAPEPVDYTGFVRGFDLRTPVQAPSGMTIPLNGPDTTSFETEAGVPVPINGGEIRTVSVTAGAKRTVQVGGPAEDVKVVYRAITLD